MIYSELVEVICYNSLNRIDASKEHIVSALSVAKGMILVQKEQPFPRLINDTQGLILADQLELADTFFTRLRGLMFRPPLLPGSALWLRPCNGVHMCFMRYPIDVLFLDRDLTVVQVVENLQPWRAVPYVPRAASAIEFVAGTLTGKVSVGDQVRII